MSVLPHVCVGDPSALALSRVRSAADQDQAFAMRRAAARRRHPNHSLRALILKARSAYPRAIDRNTQIINIAVGIDRQFWNWAPNPSTTREGNCDERSEGDGVADSALQTPTDLKAEGMREISGALNVLLADVFALYLKTKNFHWHISGPHFRDYHLLLDEHGDQIFAITDPIAERVRKIGGMTLRSIGEISRLQRIQDNDAEFVIPLDMLAELRDDNKELAAKMRETHGLCDEHNDVATASSLEVWIDEAERRAWFLFEATRAAETG